jgi:hypothetical protein
MCRGDSEGRQAAVSLFRDQVSVVGAKVDRLLFRCTAAK